MESSSPHDPDLARTLILDELFDLLLYKALRDVTQPDVHETLDELIKVETGHLAFWQKFFQLTLTRLDLGRRIKLTVMMLICRLFGSAVHLVLEAIEVHGVRKYLAIWREYQGQPLAEALRGILMDEFKHEDTLVTALTQRKINAEKIRNIFLGLNDGLVEILGAVSGFFGAFGSATMVLIAASTTAVAGALSMGPAHSWPSIYPQNLAFHKNAFALVMVPLEIPDGQWSATATEDGYRCRIVKDYDIDVDSEIIRLDVLYGVKTIYPEMACRIMGAQG